MNNKAKTFLALLVAILLSSCNSYFGNTTLTEESKLEAAKEGDFACYRNDGNTSTTRLDHAINCALATLGDFQKLQNQLAEGNATLSAGLWGLGVWAGFRAIKPEGSPAPLKNISVTVASLLGLREIANPAQKTQVLDRGVVAVQCVLDAAAGIEQAKNQIRSAPNLQGSLSQISSNNAATESDVERYSRSITQGLLLSASEGYSQLASSVNVAAENLPEQLMRAIRLIRYSVQTGLRNSQPDPSTIFNTQRTAIEEMIGSLTDQVEELEDEKKVIGSLIQVSSASLDLFPSEFVSYLSQITSSNVPGSDLKNIHEICTSS